MKKAIPLRRALEDKNLLGGTLVGDSWLPWRTLLLAAMGEELTDEEREIYTRLTRREREPPERVDEAVFVVGRRGGKTRATSTLACYIAALCAHKLVPGEVGTTLLIAPDMKQAKIALKYCEAIFANSRILKQLIANRTANALTLTNGITIEVRASDFRTLRGSTYVAVLLDEGAFLYSDEWSANADVEIVNAVTPGLMTTGGPLIIASSPYAKVGVLWNAFKKNFGPDGDPRVLVAQAASKVLNPSLPQSALDREYAKDPVSAAAEYGANFRDDIGAFVPREVVEACVGDHVELPPLSRQQYFAFCDPAGGSGSDAMTLAIAHREGPRTDEHVVVDLVREVKPPFSPEATINEFVIALHAYKISRVSGDRYAGEWPREQFRKRGVQYLAHEKVRSDLYRDLLPALTSRRIVLPRSDRLIAQLIGLERRTGRGKDIIDHSPGAHDDISNSVAGAFDVVAGRGSAPKLVLGNYDGTLWSDNDIDAKQWINPQSPRCTIPFPPEPVEPPGGGFTANYMAGQTRR